MFHVISVNVSITTKFCTVVRYDTIRYDT